VEIDDRNIVLIGMPGVGKTTIGKRLARSLDRTFVDTDRVIEEREGASLQQIIARVGLDGFRRIEEDSVAALDCRASVVATGGSVVYGERAMTHLSAHGLLVWLRLPLAILERRVGDPDARGMVRAAGQTLASLASEREPLYARWADASVAVAGLDHGETIRRIFAALERSRPTGR
jgi:shikimate kinase